MPATNALPGDPAAVKKLAEGVGYPLMLKASWGGGGRGMRPIENEGELIEAVNIGKREALSAFGKGDVYLEKLVRHARHVEVQLLGDTHGEMYHLFERDCSIQRRRQKLVERAPAPYLDDGMRAQLCDAAIKIGRGANYENAATVEFLLDVDSGAYYFIEVNPRIQVEHTVTEQVTGIDVVKAQIRIAEGGRLGVREETGVPPQASIRLNGHAMQCRITTENPENKFIPDYGRITAYRGAFGFGVRVDGGTAYSGAIVTRYYDPLLEKVTVWAPSSEETVQRMTRALREYRIRGVATNLQFLEAVLAHPQFRAQTYTTTFIDQTPELFEMVARKDRATKLLTFIADVSVNGHPEVRGRSTLKNLALKPVVPVLKRASSMDGEGSKPRLDRLGAKGFASWMRNEKRVLVTDTTMRDAHQSLLATRVRTFDIAAIAPAYEAALPQLLALECWGGATFDVAMRFLNEDPWERLALVRERAPSVLIQMLLRGANGVGYTSYPDNVVRYFVQRAAASGVDLFRVFDCMNWIENMRISIDAVVESGKLAEGAICYTGDILDPDRAKYSLRYYVDLAKELEAAGCHVLGVKDMAGLLKPGAARVLIKTLREEVGLPVHLHTHDTSGVSAASLLAAIDSGVDAIDLAVDSMSGLTSQPSLGSVVEALRGTDRDTMLDPDAIRRISLYWEAVRSQYSAFESEPRAGASEVYLHEMPGGQYTNLKEQARSLGLEARWHEVSKAYREANDLFGDIVKVTPSSKAVGDMALMMVSQGLTPEMVMDPARSIAFPASVVEMLRGDLGQPLGGWPSAIQNIVLKGAAASTARPGSLLPDANLRACRIEVETQLGQAIDDNDFASSLMYPKVFANFVASSALYGPVSTLPTNAFFHGMKIGEEIAVEIERGKTLVILLQAISERDELRQVKVFFELNGQPRVATVPDRSVAGLQVARPKAVAGDPQQIGAPMPGLIASVLVQAGQSVKAGDVLLTIEAMKMELALRAPVDGIVKDVLVRVGAVVDEKDLLVAFERPLSQ